MKVHASGEDYLEDILRIQKKGMVCSTDLARYMKAEYMHAIRGLKQGVFLTMDSAGDLHLTDERREAAECIYEKYQFFTDSLIEMALIWGCRLIFMKTVHSLALLWKINGFSNL